MRRTMKKPVILIGGTAGTGKSTLARELSSRLGLDHRLGTGFIREVAKAFNSPESVPELYSFTFRSARPVENLIAQARLLKPAIDACIARALNEGTSLVIEGNHLIPELYAGAAVDLYVVLAAPEPAHHRTRLNGLSHAKRRLGEDDVANVRRIGDYLRDEATRRRIPYILYEDNLGYFVDLVSAGK